MSKILLVEDNALAQKLTMMVLKNMGQEVVLAEDGEACVQLVKEQTFDLIFMDLGLPGIDGFTATGMIRQLESESAHVPIVALTAHADDESRQQCIESGMDDFFQKPLTVEKANSIFEKFLK